MQLSVDWTHSAGFTIGRLRKKQTRVLNDKQTMLDEVCRRSLALVDAKPISSNIIIC